MIYGCFFLLSGVFFPYVLLAETVTHSKIEFRRSFETGETLNFKVKYLGITGGYATISAKPLDRERIEFKLTARTAPWVENIYSLQVTMLSETLLDTYQTLRYLEDKKEKNRVYYNVQDFDLNAKTYTFSYLKNGILKTKSIDYGNPSKGEPLEGGLSVTTAFFFSRTLDLETGVKVYTNCFFRDSNFQVGVEAVEQKRIRTAFGKRKVRVVRPLLPRGKIITDQQDMLIYLSDDNLRIPLRVDIITTFGTLRVLLTDYSSSFS